MIALVAVLAALLGGPIGTLTLAGRDFVISWIDVAGVAVAAVGLVVARRRDVRVWDPALWGVAALLVVFLLQAVTGGNGLEILGGSSRFVTAAAVLAGLTCLLPRFDDRDVRVEQALAVFAGVLALLVVADVVAGLLDPARQTFYDVKNGIVLPLGASNYLAPFVAVPAVLLATRTAFGARLSPWLAAVATVGVAATLSRGAVIAVAAGALVAVVGRWRPRTGLVVAGLVAIAVLVGSLFLAAVGSARLADVVGSTGDGRLVLLGAAWDGFLDAPLLGVGLNNLVSITGSLAQPHDNAHNLLLHALATTGVVGAVAYLWLWGLLAHRLWRAQVDGWRVAIAAAATTLFVHAAIEALAFTRAVDVLLMLLLALAWRLPGARATGATDVPATPGPPAAGSTLGRTSQGSIA